MKEKEEPYKVELIEDLPEDAEISFYQQGEFVDLCAGPHLMSTKTGEGLQAHQPGRRLLERQREKQDADPYLRYCIYQESRSGRVSLPASRRQRSVTTESSAKSWVSS